jgi:hypothetical protein
MASPSGIASSWCSCAYDVLAVAAMSSATAIRRPDKSILTFVRISAAFPALKRNLLDSFPREFPWHDIWEPPLLESILPILFGG